MSRYKIHIDPPNPDPDRIRDHQNFDALFQDYRTVRRFDFWRNLYRNPRVFAGIAAAVLLVVLVFQANQEESSTGEVAGLPVAYSFSPDQVWTLDASRDTILSLAEEWSLMLPAGSLLDTSGQPWKGPYRLAFRKLDQPAEQFLSGINGADQPFFLEATAKDMRLQPGKGIELRSRTPVPGQLSQLQQQWMASASLPPIIEEGSMKGPRPEPPAILREYEEAGSKAVTSAPQRPGRPFGVNIDNLGDFPQFRGYNRVFWEHVPKEGMADPWADGLVNDTMSQARIRPWQEDIFELTFVRVSPDGGISRQRFLARPYAGAQTEAEVRDIYDSRMQRYQQELEAWNQARQAFRQLEQEAEAARIRYEEQLRTWESQDSGSQPDTLYRWKLEQFGYWGIERKDHQFRDSVEITLYLDEQHASQAEPLIQAFAYSQSDQRLVRGLRKGDSWVFPNNHRLTQVWAYGRDHIWTGNIPLSTKGSVTLQLLPDHLITTEDIIRHLEGVL